MVSGGRMMMEKEMRAMEMARRVVASTLTTRLTAKSWTTRSKGGVRACVRAHLHREGNKGRALR